MFYKLLRFIVLILAFIIFRIDIKGKENIPEEGRLIIAANHISFIDPVMLAFCTRRPIHFMGKKELFENKFLSWFFTKLNAFPVDRDGSDLAAVKHSLKILNNDEVLGIFPEGTRVKEFDIENAKAGVGLLALKTKTPVVPVYIDANYKIFGKININIGKPILYNDIIEARPKKSDYDKVGKDILIKIYEQDNKK